MVSVIDVVILLVIFAFTIAGFIFGFIHTLGALVGTVLATFVASRVVGPVSALFGGGRDIAAVAIFVIVFLIISRLVGLIFWLIDRVFKVISVIPFTKSVNRILGSGLGLLEGIIVVGAVIYVASAVLPEAWFHRVVEPSILALPILEVFSIFAGLLPELLRDALPEDLQ